MLSGSDSTASFEGSLLPMLLQVAANSARGDFFCSSSCVEIKITLLESNDEVKIGDNFAEGQAWRVKLDNH